MAGKATDLPEGIVGGVIYDAETGEIVKDAEVSSTSKNIEVMMPLMHRQGGSIYFVAGETGVHRIMVVASGYEAIELDIFIKKGSQEHHIYLKKSKYM